MGEISQVEFFPPLARFLASENCRYHAAQGYRIAERWGQTFTYDI